MAKTKEEKAAYNRAYSETHRGEIAARQEAWWQTHKEERLAVQRAYRRGLVEGSVQKEKSIVYGRAYRETHREKAKAASCAWAKAHPAEVAEKTRLRRARKRGATIGPIDRAAIKRRDRMLCCICGKKVDERLKHPHPDSLSYDHSHPLSRGGAHSQENQRVAHLHCNLERHTGLLPVQMVML